jgi:hypothetical protein
MQTIQVTKDAIFINEYKVRAYNSLRNVWSVETLDGVYVTSFHGDIFDLLSYYQQIRQQPTQAQKGAVKLKKIVVTNNSIILHQNRIELKQYYDKIGREYWLTEKDGIFHNIQQANIFKILTLTSKLIKTL